MDFLRIQFATLKAFAYLPFMLSSLAGFTISRHRTPHCDYIVFATFMGVIYGDNLAPNA